MVHPIHPSSQNVPLQTLKVPSKFLFKYRKPEFSPMLETVEENRPASHKGIAGHVATTTDNSISEALESLDRSQQALIKQQRALAVWERVFGKEFSDSNLATNYTKIGKSLLALGRPQEALQHFQRALELQKRSWNDPLLPAATYNKIGECLLALDRPQEALQHFQAALNIWEDAFFVEDLDDHTLSAISSNMRQCLVLLGKPIPTTFNRTFNGSAYIS